MKKTIITILSFLFFLVSRAQVATFVSSGFATTGKDSKGNFVQVKEWTVQQIRINFNLSRKKVQFFSKGMLDSDTFNLKKEIFIVGKSTNPGIVDTEMMQFSGTDRSGKKCTVTLKLIKDEYKMQDGELRVEYTDRAEIYILRTFRQNPTLNKS